ncbi:3-phosphoshikimate 1-carboxyvinyltransferase [Lacibacter sp.]|uniref:3-phosphoshikimate 1-carboxyvinyltransferase n=1 Tax=Lacibacter sp. TaxID=1915409 RepID=UPI002B4B03E0|nr:3-phosphoshikimate 1-carboxyvinyltransferase [Lacibacter sp.]HLP37283.1 3-phosphoshikimate 1-carboxyvinyltransferase [Lacibacter sp.]
MKVTIQPSTLTGTIQSNASKSSMQRACAAALVAKGKSIIKNPGHSNDDKAAMDITQRLGGTVTNNGNELIIESNGVQPVSSEINCGESGLSIRMFTPLVALSNHELAVNGTGSLTTRPMDFFDEILPQLGVHVKSNQGKLPLNIQGPIVPKNITIDGSLSSQFLTGLLLAYAASDASNVSITVTNLKSKPYIDLTLDVMKQFGLKVPENRNYEEFYFAADTHHSSLITHHYTVEGDWSGAAFLLVAGAVAGNIVVKGLDVFSTQADKAVLQALMDCGCIISIQPEQIEIGPAPLKPFHFNATECPDLFPPLVALAAFCNGKSVIEGTTRLTHKESNRAITLQEEFAKLGVTIELQDDLMIIHGGGGLKGATVHSRHDHRIAMACAVAALKAEGEVTIEEAEAINKSYPDFYEHLKVLGANVSL